MEGTEAFVIGMVIGANQQFGQPMNQQFGQQVNQQPDSENN